jgi:hypothetical protein
LTSQIEGLDGVPNDSFELLRRWYDEESGGDSWLRGVEARVFRDESCQADLISLVKRAGKDDPIAGFIAERVLPLYDRVLGHRVHHSASSKAMADAREYQMKTMVRLASAVCMVLSAALPAAAILMLSHVKSLTGRLVGIVMMSLVFALIMVVVTRRKADVFISVTAFSAIMVVFVQQT